MWIVFRLLAAFTGIFSFTALVQHAFDIGFVPVLQLVIDYFDRFLNAALGWTEPYIGILLDRVSELLSVDLSLNPHWKHILVIMSVYIGSNIKHILLRGTTWAKIFNTPVAVIVTIVSSLGAGTIAVNGKRDMLVAAIPMLGLAVFELLFQMRLASDRQAFNKVYIPNENECEVYLEFCWAQRFRKLNKATLYFLAVIGFLAFLLGALGVNPPILAHVSNPGIAWFTMLTVVLVFYMLGHTLYRSVKFRTDKYPSWFSQFLSDGTANVVRYMSITIAGTALFLIANAGLQLLGI